MEVVHHRCKASKVSPQGRGEDDVISSMPDNVIANIMDRLPLQDAVGTSILSTNWRFKWTFLTQLVFFPKFFYNIFSRKIHFDKTNITKLLLHLKVTKFWLCINDAFKLDDDDIYHWVMFLSRMGGLKELTLSNVRQTPFKLPTHLFACQELTHLRLDHCVFLFPSYFRGFPKLLTLDLRNVSIQDYKYGDLIALCPLLENLRIWDSNLRGEAKLVEIVKLLENVKLLDLSVCLFDINMTMVRLFTVFQHMSLLPKLQVLCLRFENCKFLPEDVAQNPVSPIFPFLKDLRLCQMDFSSVSMLSCAFGIIVGCTNLQNLWISAIYKNVVPPPAVFPPEVNCSTLGQLQLQNVYLKYIKGLENEVCLIKCILASSPMLKRIEILLDSSTKSNGTETYKLAGKLLKLHRASPIAEVIF